ncbi:MAG: MBL fold metallo-hydrolase [Solirubrobacteraceae bacterium]
MLVTVLGKSPAWEDAGGACSGYLIREGDFTLLLECGNGVFSKLRAACDYADVDAILLTHMHADHFFDVIPFAYALTHSPRRARSAPPPRPRLHLPPGGLALLRPIVESLGADGLIETAFEPREYDPENELTLGPLRARLRPVPHYVPTHAVAVQGEGGRLAFSADCRPNDELVRLAAGADLLLIEATLSEPEPEGTGGHLAAREAGEHGARAGVRRLVLTHFSDELDPGVVRARGAEGYGADVELAREGAAYVV